VTLINWVPSDTWEIIKDPDEYGKVIIKYIPSGALIACDPDHLSEDARTLTLAFLEDQQSALPG
jgi:hypothetical protein